MNRWMTTKPLCLAAALLAGMPAVSFAKGDPAAGREKSQVCQACHGLDGKSVAPSIQLANWYSESSEVELVVSSVVELGQEVTVEIPTGNIVLPVKGLDANQLALKLRTNAAAGPNPGVSVTTSQAVGSLWSESKLPYLGFDYLYLDFPATITLKLTTTMPVAVGEHFNLSLPGFTNVRGESVDDVELDSYWGSRMSGKWLQEHSTFYFTMKVSVDIGVLYEVVISSNNGVR